MGGGKHPLPMELRHFQPIQHVAVIVNPASGGAEAPLRALNDALADYESTLQVTQTAQDAARFSREAVARGADLIIAYGGDGTISQVLDGLDGAAVPVLILRGGTGNVMADELMLPEGIPDSLALIAGGEAWARPIDLGIVNQAVRFVLRCGCGLEVQTLQETVHDQKSSWGKLAYAGGLWKGLSGHPTLDFRIWLDAAAEPITASGVSLTVANAGRIGAGPLRIAPTVSVEDGLLDVCLIEEASLETVMEFFLPGLAGAPTPPGSLQAPSLIRVQQAKRIRVETGTPVPFHVDGEVKGNTPFEIEVSPAAAWVVVAPGSAGESGA